MRIVAPHPFAHPYEPTAALDRALAPHELVVAADPGRELAVLGHAEILVTGFEGQEHEAIDYARAMPRLRWIHSLIAGLGSIACEEIAQRGVIVTNGAGVFAVSIAEYAFAALVMLARGLPELVLAGAACRWEESHPRGRELDGGRALVIGYGGIGRRVAALLASAGMRVDAVTRTPGAHEPGTATVHSVVDLPALLAAADAIVICASLNPTTEGLLGSSELRHCKAGAMLVNVARGRLLDETALVAALTDGPLSGAIIDVTETEPLPAESPLWKVPNLWITPHLAGGTREGAARALDRFVVNLTRFAAGDATEMISVVDLRREISDH